MPRSRSRGRQVADASSPRRQKGQVKRGTRTHTPSQMTADDIVYNKHGAAVSRRKSALGKKSLWGQAFTQAYYDLGFTEFVPLNRMVPKGRKLYDETVANFEELKAEKERKDSAASSRSRSRSRSPPRPRSRTRTRTRSRTRTRTRSRPHTRSRPRSPPRTRSRSRYR